MRGLVVIIDGCNIEYIDATTTPFLHHLKKQGGFSRITVTPSFANRVEIMTGNSPATTDTFVDFCYDPENSPFKILKFLKTPINLKQRRSIFRKVLAALSYLTCGYGVNPVNIPLSFLPYFSPNKSIIEFIRKERERDESHLFGILEKNGFKVTFIYGSVEYIRERLKRYSTSKDEILFIHYGDSDKTGHKYGPNSMEIREVLRIISESIKDINNSLGPFDFIAIFGDHNMVEVKNTINIWERLMKLNVKPLKDYLFFLNSPMVRFWFNNEYAKEKIRDFLTSLSCGRIITEKELKERELPIDMKYGEIIFWMKKGWHITPDFYHMSKIKGMHGYIDDLSETPLIIFNRHEKIKLKAKGKLKDIAPTLLDILNIKCSKYMEGSSLLVRE